MPWATEYASYSSPKAASGAGVKVTVRGERPSDTSIVRGASPLRSVKSS
jgi:hypothetical protein